MQYLRDSLKPS